MDEVRPVGNSHLNKPSSVTAGQHLSQWQRTLDALRESDDRFRTLAECAPVVVWMTDVDHRCTYISKYWRQFTGRDPELDLGFTWVEALHPDDRDRAARDLMEAGKAVGPCRGEYRVKRANGEYGWLFDFGVPYFREFLASDIRRLSRNLHPSTVIQLGLLPSLRQLCREFSEQMHIPIEFVGGSITSSLPEEVAVALFRVGQECLANIAKHSKSPEACVSVSEESGEVCLTITDQGIGFDASKLQAHPGLGLISIQERARIIGADLEIRSTPSGGTKVELRVPTSIFGLG